MGVLDSLQLNFKRTTRRGQQIVYCKDSASIEEILTMVGATGSMMDVVNVKIYKDMRNNPVFKVFYLKNIDGWMTNLGHVKGLEQKAEFARPVHFRF